MVVFYAQDEWKLNDRLTLIWGWVYDLEFLRSMHSEDNISPTERASRGLHFLSEDGSVRGSLWDLPNDRIPLRPLSQTALFQ